MLTAPWICSRCARHLTRDAARSSLRFQSTATTSSLISPILLDRARAVAAEHTKLSAENARNYDIKVARRLGELTSVTNALGQWEDAQNSITELNSLLHDSTTDQELRTLAADDLASTTSSLTELSTALKTALVPPHPFSALPCLIEIHPGAGGSEASIFASELLRMYQSFCSRRNWRTSMIKEDRADSEGGPGTALIDAVMEVHAPSSYDTLRVEAGVHRVQRVPATERKGRTHTSAVSVMVLPSLPDTGSDTLDYDNPDSDYYVAAADVRSETMRARGAGGQHVNTTDSAVRLTHLPTGLVVGMQEERSQHKNREKAWRVLRAKLAQRRREEREDEVRKVRRNVMGGVGKTDRGDKVRTYHFEQNRVSDHRVAGAEVRDLEGVMEGGEGLERLMGWVRGWMVEGEVMAMAAVEEGKGKEGDGEAGGGSSRGGSKSK